MCWNQADPFLKLVEDRKLQAVGTGSGHQTNVYGSTEDDAAALKSLSHIQFTEDQTREYCASVILKTLGSLPEVTSGYPLSPECY